ncbi:MAG: hypothetical protein NTX41_07550 [Verrucomicrobia bacterium]|nr:hypothetical protein [Verrucomicrobiota bacterium]
MKNILRLLTLVAVCSSLAIAATTPAAPAKKDAPAAPAVDTSKFKTGGCCEKADKAGKPCAHPCCVKAAKDAKVCEKCNPAAKDAPAPSKDAPAAK